MKSNKIYMVLLAAATFAVACKKDMQPEGGAPDRLFRPVIKGTIEAPDNSVSVQWQKITGAKSYTAQISRDTFKTVDATLALDSTHAVFQNLKWEQLYQVRVKAIAPDTTKNSGYNQLGAVTTPKFPTILTNPSPADVTDNAIKLKWTNAGAAVTSVKVFLASNTTTPVKEITLTPANVSAQFLDITGLQASTAYVVYLYSGTTVRGWNNYTTSAALTGTIVDLRSSDDPNILTTTLPTVASGSTVVLKKGMTYTVAATITVDKSMKIVSGADLNVSTPATILVSAGSFIGVKAGTTVDYLDFENVIIRGVTYASSSGSYVINQSANCNIGRVSFENCESRIWRGFVRVQSGTINITNFSVNNCIIDNLGGYGVLTVDATTCKVDNISLTRSTFFLCEKVVTSKQNSVSLNISDNTFYQTPLGGGYIIDYNGVSITGATTVKNNIFSIAKGTTATPPVTTTNGKRGTMTIDDANNYATSDYADASAANAFPNTNKYAKSSTELFTDPNNGNFKIKDNTFSARSTTGDPRWRP